MIVCVFAARLKAQAEAHQISLTRTQYIEVCTHTTIFLLLGGFTENPNTSCASSSLLSLSLPLFHFLTHSQTIFRTDTHTVNTPSSPPLTWLSCVMGPGSDQETKRWQCNFLSRCSLYSECLPSRQLAREDFERLQFELYTIARKVLTINIMASVRVPLPIFLLMRSPS